MFKKLSVNMKKIYPTLVVATMSSGKSTLINALIGKDLLPSRNMACTAKALAILDNDLMDGFRIHAVTADGKYSKIENATKEAVNDFNFANNVSEMILEGQIRGIKNSKKSLFLIDTPGFNNSLDDSHELVTRKVLDEFDEGLILYIIDAMHMATYDDSAFLELVAEKLKAKPRFNIIFAVNKADAIDPKRESLDGLVANCKDYIESKGIKEPVIIPVSAAAALMFKKVLAGDDLSEFETDEFPRYLKRFGNNGFSLANYVNIAERGDLSQTVDVDGTLCVRAELYGALYNTGLTLLETVIDETLVRSLKMKAPEIKKAAPQKNTVGKRR